MYATNLEIPTTEPSADLCIMQPFQVCTARQVYQECLGSAYISCIDPIFLIKMGLSKKVAFDYLSIMFTLEFNCIQGFSGE